MGIDITQPERVEGDDTLSKCLFLEADLTDEKQLNEVCQEACKWLGGQLQVLINNAGKTFSFDSKVVARSGDVQDQGYL